MDIMCADFCKSDPYFWFLRDFGYIEKLQGEYVLREDAIPVCINRGRYTSIEAAKLAAEIIYSTRSES